MTTLTFNLKITIDNANKLAKKLSVSNEALEDYIKDACMTGERGFARALHELGIWHDMEVKKVKLDE